MSISDPQTVKTDAAPARKPRLAIMGEFSVGKSTLSNLLLGASPLPVKVTATQLPPVWLSHGTQAPYREDLEGNRSPVDLDNLALVPLDETAVIRIFLEADILEMCDLIDMPGISDPNMSSDIWQRILHHADGVLWCTHATQAWRQSEAAVWKSLPPELYARSYLLITRIDKLLSEHDRSRVIKRARRETKGMFAGIFPISLTRAIGAQDDLDQWEQSGADAFFKALVTLLHDLSATLDTTERPLLRTPAPPAAGGDKVLQLPVAANDAPGLARIRPLRVRVAPEAGAATERPPRRETPSSPANSALGTGRGF